MRKIDSAFNLYQKHIFDLEKINLLHKYNLKVAGSVSSVLWELFGAILTGKSGSGLTGSDLQGWEVKSSKIGGSYEYQYHLNSGAEKLNEDCRVNHLFCSYSEEYRDVIVRAIKGSDLAENFFQSWMPEYVRNYNSDLPARDRRQRFRKSIPYGYIAQNAILILDIRDGCIISRNDDQLELLNAT